MAAAAGLAGPLLFAVVLLTLTTAQYGFMRSLGWDPIMRPTFDWPSGLSLGPLGSVMTGTLPERHVPLQLPEEPVPQLAAGDELAIPARERAVVHDEVHRDRGLFDRDALQPLGMSTDGEGLADLDAVSKPESATMSPGRRPPPPRPGGGRRRCRAW